MSTNESEIVRRLAAIELRLREPQTERAHIILPFVQRVLNPFPLVSSGAVWGDAPLPWAVSLTAYLLSVFVATTNTGANYWTLALVNQALTPLASVTTAALAANTWARLSVTSGITQPASSDQTLLLIPTATGIPGAIYIVPIVTVARV